MNELLWKKYVVKKVINTNELPDKIANSWEICRQENLNPFQTKSSTILTFDQLFSKQQANKMMIELVKEEIKKISHYFYKGEFMFVLTDADGYILWRQGNARAVDYANTIGFWEGSRWNELDVGTNAISLTLRNKQSEAVTSFEHYNVASHDWSCFASPIFDEDTLVGVLDVSSFNHESTEYQVFTQLIVERVMNRLLRNRLNHNHALLSYVAGNDSEGILCNERYQIVHLPEEYEKFEELSIGSDIQSFCRNYESLYNVQEIYQDKELIGYKYKFYNSHHAKDKYYPGIPSKNEAYQKFLKRVFRAAESELPMHIQGESGSGKDIIAQTIHYNSAYKEGPLLSLNCGSLSENLLESELFGYAAGAFTGASKEGYIGKIRQAEGGTLFLDEVDCMSLKMQAALLRVIEEKKVTPIGSDKSAKVDFRIVTATNGDLKEAVAEGRFREDLYYRLYICPLQIPPLRERKEDILALIKAFCQKNNWQIDWQEDLYEWASAFPWYGNIREFNNFLERVYLFYPEGRPSREDLNSMIEMTSLNQPDQSDISALQGEKQENSEEICEAEEIARALKENNYHKTKTAEKLNMSRTTLYRKIKKYRIV